MQKPSAQALPSLSVRIDLDTEGRIGPGKIALLENIREHGSISAAGRAMDMSYKRAWDLVDEINRICRQAAVEQGRYSSIEPTTSHRDPYQTNPHAPPLRRSRARSLLR